MDIDLEKDFRLLGLRLERWFTVFVIIIVVAAWEIGVRIGEVSSLFFPAPSVILLTFVRLIANGKLLTNAGASFLRVFWGLALGGGAGLILGFVMGWSHRLYGLIDPLIAAAHPVPKIAILPIIMILFGIGESSKVVIVAVTTFFPMLINTIAGVRQISPIHFEVAKNYGADITKIFTRVILPGSLPLVLTGVRLAFNMALLMTIAVELVAAQKGLGAMIWMAWQTLRTEGLYVSLFVTAGLGILFNFFLQRITFHLIPWQIEQNN